jgi:hypothetical protein
MPSTDIDGSVIVILSEAEARALYHFVSLFLDGITLSGAERTAIDKIARDLNLPPLE